MGIFRKKDVEVCCGLYPLVAVLAPFALGVGVEHLDDFAGFGRVIVEDGSYRSGSLRHTGDRG